MATTRNFNTMLNEYLPNSLMREELIKRDWFLTNVKKDDSWLGGQIIVPFEGNNATSLAFGSLTAANDVSEYNYVRGTIAAYKEVWGTLLFQHTDLMQHGSVSEKNFLKMLPGQIDQFINYFKEAVSINLLGGPHFASVVLDVNLGGGAGVDGVTKVDHIDRFSIGQKVYLNRSGVAENPYYVVAIDVNNSYVTLSAARAGAGANISANYLLVNTPKFYHDGILDTGTHLPSRHFNSVKSSLLSYANGGSQNLHGQVKTAYPYLQCINVDGGAITAVNILDKIFDAYTDFRAKAKSGAANKVVLSYKHLGSIMKLLEVQKGQNNYKAGSPRINVYGWTEIDVTSVRGMLTIVGIQEMENSEIFILDMSSMVFRSNGFFRRRKSPDGSEYYETRATTGYSYLIDMCLFGELEVTAPAKNLVINGVANY